jgi:DNA-directed RNA polymerase omega subunit
MARVTIEDCAKKIQNRFELCMIAAQRVKEMNAGSPSVLSDLDPTDKLGVVALKEIAAGLLNHDALREILIKTMKLTGHLDESIEGDSSTQNESDKEGNFNSEIQSELLFSGDEEGFEQINDNDGENFFEDDIEEDEK